MELIISLKELQMKVMILLWQWWLERNRVREGERRRSTDEIAHIIEKQSAELLKEDQGVGQSLPPSNRWCRPSSRFLKIYTGSFKLESGSGGWGFVIRDDNAEVTHAGAGSCQHLLDAFYAELLACHHGVSEVVR